MTLHRAPPSPYLPVPAATGPVTRPPAAAGRRPLALLLLAGALAAAALAPPPAAARGLALLIGIGDYRDAAITDLEGPPNDVAAVSEVLTTRWGFQPEAVRTLVDAQASRSAILDGIDALARDSRPGDLVLIYYSGHGTSPLDPRAAGLPLPHGSGALTAWDGVLEPPDRVIPSLLVGRTDLVPRLTTLDRGGRQVVVLIDACYSANATRGLYAAGPAGLATRLLPLPPQPGFDLGAYGTGRIAPPPPYPYARVLTLAAAAAGEPAADIGAAQLRRYPTFDRRPHGAFSNALLGVLRGDYPADADGDGAVSYLELRDAIDRQLTSGGFRHRPQQFPQVTEDPDHLGARAIFAVPAAPGPGQAAVRRVPDLGVRLAPAAAALAESIGTLPGLTLADPAPAVVVDRRDGAWLLTNPGGDRIGTAADATALAARLRQLAWFHQLAWRGGQNPFALALAPTDASRGTIHYLDSPVHLDLRPARQGWLVLLYVDAQGAVAPLYPARPAETQPLAAGAKVSLPADDSLKVTEPLGTDLVLALVYANRPAFLERIVAHLAPLQGPAPLPPDGPLLREIIDSLTDESGVAVATLKLETMPAPPAP